VVLEEEEEDIEEYNKTYRQSHKQQQQIDHGNKQNKNNTNNANAKGRRKSILKRKKTVKKSDGKVGYSEAGEENKSSFDNTQSNFSVDANLTTNSLVKTESLS
jgi:hypothetical protein